MKVVYVLVSGDNDFYYEQALASLWSLKKVMPNMSSSLIVDDKTAISLDGRKKILEYVDEYKIVNIPNDINGMLRSRYLKTSLRNLVVGDFLYVDVDTVWTQKINESDFTSDIMGVPDSHRLYKEALKINFDASFRKLNFYCDYKYLINGGVLFMKDSSKAHKFSQSWHRLWLESCTKGIYTDQQSLNQANYEHNDIIGLLPNEYNVQISYSIRYLFNAKLLHYFACSADVNKEAFLLKQNEFWIAVKRNGLSAEICAVLENVKMAWKIDSQVLSKDYIDKQSALLSNPLVGFVIAMIQSKKSLIRAFAKTLTFFVEKITCFYNRF